MSDENQKKWLWVVGVLVAVVLLVGGGYGGSRITRDRLAEEHLRQIGQLEGELEATRESLEAAEDSLVRSRLVIAEATNRVGRSQEIAGQLGAALGELSTGADEIDVIIGQFAIDLEWIARELSSVYAGITEGNP